MVLIIIIVAVVVLVVLLAKNFSRQTSGETPVGNSPVVAEMMKRVWFLHNNYDYDFLKVLVIFIEPVNYYGERMSPDSCKIKLSAMLGSDSNFLWGLEYGAKVEIVRLLNDLFEVEDGKYLVYDFPVNHERMKNTIVAIGKEIKHFLPRLQTEVHATNNTKCYISISF